MRLNKTDTSFIRLPKLALCKDRNVLPKSNYIHGEPTDWFTNENLDKYNLKAITVDFFVNWSTNPVRLSRNVWVKRILQDDPKIFTKENGDLNFERAIEALCQYEGEENIRFYCEFFSRNNINLDFLLFRDINWGTNPENIILIRPKINNGKIEYVGKFIDLNDLKRRISLGSGGPVHIGKKGLIYGTSTLECHLSKTQYAYPGDVDLILVNKNTFETEAIIEYKKHNLDSKISEQCLSNYYPNPDARKYDRLMILKNHLGTKTLLINLYYPTKNENNSKIEVINGKYRSLISGKSKLIAMPNVDDIKSILLYMKETISFINELKKLESHND